MQPRGISYKITRLINGRSCEIELLSGTGFQGSVEAKLSLASSCGGASSQDIKYGYFTSFFPFKYGFLLKLAFAKVVDML